MSDKEKCPYKTDGCNNMNICPAKKRVIINTLNDAGILELGMSSINVKKMLELFKGEDSTARIRDVTLVAAAMTLLRAAKFECPDWETYISATKTVSMKLNA